MKNLFINFIMVVVVASFLLIGTAEGLDLIEFFKNNVTYDRQTMELMVDLLKKLSAKQCTKCFHQIPRYEIWCLDSPVQLRLNIIDRFGC